MYNGLITMLPPGIFHFTKLESIHIVVGQCRNFLSECCGFEDPRLRMPPIHLHHLTESLVAAHGLQMLEGVIDQLVHGIQLAGIVPQQRPHFLLVPQIFPRGIVSIHQPVQYAQVGIVAFLPILRSGIFQQPFLHRRRGAQSQPRRHHLHLPSPSLGIAARFGQPFHQQMMQPKKEIQTLRPEHQLAAFRQGLRVRPPVAGGDAALLHRHYAAQDRRGPEKSLPPRELNFVEPVLRPIFHHRALPVEGGHRHPRGYGVFGGILVLSDEGDASLRHIEERVEEVAPHAMHPLPIVGSQGALLRREGEETMGVPGKRGHALVSEGEVGGEQRLGRSGDGVQGETASPQLLHPVAVGDFVERAVLLLGFLLLGVQQLFPLVSSVRRPIFDLVHQGAGGGVFLVLLSPVGAAMVQRAVVVLFVLFLPAFHEDLAGGAPLEIFLAETAEDHGNGLGGIFEEQIHHFLSVFAIDAGDAVDVDGSQDTAVQFVLEAFSTGALVGAIFVCGGGSLRSGKLSTVMLQEIDFLFQEFQLDDGGGIGIDDHVSLEGDVFAAKQHILVLIFAHVSIGVALLRSHGKGHVGVVEHGGLLRGLFGKGRVGIVARQSPVTGRAELAAIEINLQDGHGIPRVVVHGVGSPSGGQYLLELVVEPQMLPEEVLDHLQHVVSGEEFL
mmetsp:Transcript_21266/g.48309  ORF Transcript_21266/g.48309 Transcript_21266/m.48309 type:complete len:668 (-) Transcript_21266:298-2301(-)